MLALFLGLGCARNKGRVPRVCLIHSRAIRKLAGFLSVDSKHDDASFHMSELGDARGGAADGASLDGC